MCLDCTRCQGKPPLPQGETSPEAVTQTVVAQVERIVCQQNAGTLDLNSLDYFEWKLLEIYRDEEAARERAFRIQTKVIFEAWLKQGN